MEPEKPTKEEVEDALFKLKLIAPNAPELVAYNFVLVRKNLGEIAARDALEQWLETRLTRKE